jgi:tetratricopeptide (TPR) repeat protein
MEQKIASARQLYEKGLKMLAVSQCWAAEEAFRNARDVLLLLPDTAEPRGQEVSWVDVEGNLAFALVCAQRYQEGVNLLERILNGPLSTTSSRLMNALGFAHFHLKNYVRAKDAFKAATAIDSLNPVLWNNLGAARMQLGQIHRADEALFYAVDQTEPGGQKHYYVDDYYRKVFLKNVERLHARASWSKDGPVRGLELGIPQVELWQGDGQL